MLISEFKKAYAGQLSVQLVLLGSHASHLALPDPRRATEQIKRLVPSQSLALFPQFYLATPQVASNLGNLCQVLGIQLREEDTGYAAFCPGANIERPEPVADVRREREVMELQTKSMLASNLRDFETDRDLYQIFFWVSVAFFVVILVSVYTVANMTFKKATLLFSSFNPNWDERSGRSSF